MWKTILIIVVVLVAGVLAFAATRPDTFAVQRSTTINASADKIFPLINDMHGFNRWNPYLRKDPQLKGTYAGPSAGPGAHYAWEGNKEVGKGSMTVARSQAPSVVDIDLAFIEPFESKSKITFTIQPGTAGTQVTWAMNGPALFITKVMGIFVNMDKMIGTDFEVGLANLKILAEQN